jgi:tRNA(fMet)-specific endonuclease VapC
LQQLGKPPSFIDAQIAAEAYTNQLILVTRNISDFQYFSDLTVENWF